MSAKQITGILFFLVLAYAICNAEVASWYGDEAAGRRMANGQPFNPKALTAASYRYPLGTRLRVSCGKKNVIVFLTDRGPNRRLGRDIDLSRAAFERLAPLRKGLIQVTIEKL